MSSASSGVVSQRGYKMDPNNAIEIRNISKAFKIKVADGSKKSISGKTKVKNEVHKVLDNISLDIKRGDVLGILGRNGSGKSTFLSILARIMEPDTGTIERGGKIAAILELGMGFHPDMSGRENIYTKGEMFGFSKKEMDAKVEEIIEYSGVRKYIDNPIRTYSSGMAGRLAFAVMVNVDSEIVLVDEVLSVGDSSFSAKAKQHFIEMAASGKTVLIVSHNLSYIEEVCNRTIWIEDGRIAMDGTPDEVVPEYINKISESPEIILDLAKSGVGDAQYKLALMYRDGIYFEKDMSKYESWLESAAEKRSVRAQVMYGDILMSKGKREQALNYYLNAAERGDGEARVKVASLSSYKESEAEIIADVYERLLISGNTLMEYRYAELMLRTAWSDEDRERAFDMFLKSAKGGFPDALYQVAVMYRDGIGTAKNYEEMRRFLVESAENGYMQSITLLADIYTQGRLLPKDRKVAFKWTLRAAELGNRDFMYRVAVMYRDGIGVEKNLEESNKWFGRYEDSNLFQQYALASNFVKSEDISDLEGLFEKASYSMNSGMLYSYLLNTEDPKIKKKIIKALEDIAKGSNQDAIVKLGNIYHDGIKVDVDYERALYWFDWGSMHGNPYCQQRSGEMYRDGIGTKKDLERAISYFRDSAIQGNTRCMEYLIRLSYADMDKRSDLYRRSFNLLQNHAQSGNIDAINKIANMYYDGDCVGVDHEMAMYWFKKGAELGDRNCKKRIAED